MSGAADAKRAAEILARGGVVAFPTETVYGLGADASNAAAVRRVFAIKGRPATNPVIVHVADVEGARRCVGEWPATAQKLAERFWPGPLTIVLPKADAIAAEVTAGGETVGVRVPNHPLALQTLKEFALLKEAESDEATKRRSDEAAGTATCSGVAAPSANRSSRVSPTRAQHVRDDLGEPGGDAGTPDMILDGGPCTVGIESTVISLAMAVPTVLRPGGVSVEQLCEVLGDVAVRGGSDAGPAASPGRQERHYGPQTPVILIDSKDRERILGETGGIRSVMLAVGETDETMAVADDEQAWPLVLLLPARPDLYARQFYTWLRNADALGSKRIFIELPPDDPEWRAVRDRIKRAAQEGHE